MFILTKNMLVGTKERNSQKEERDLLNKSTDEAMAKIADLNN